MSGRRGRPDSYPLLRLVALAVVLGVAGLVMDVAGRCVGAVLRAVGVL